MESASRGAHAQSGVIGEPLDHVTEALAALPDVETALVAVRGPDGAIRVLSLAGRTRRASSAFRAFVARAVASERPLQDALDSAPAAIGHALSAPVGAAGGTPAALCVGLGGALRAPSAELEQVVDSCARLAARWLRDAQRSSTPAAVGQRDERTGCLTYAALLQHVHHEIDRCERLDLDLACCFIDPGHLGDDRRLMADTADALHSVVGTRGTVGRYGRWRFVAVLPGTDADAARRLAGSMRTALRGASRADWLEAAVGVAPWVRGTGVDRLLGDADSEMNKARLASSRRLAPSGSAGHAP